MNTKNVNDALIIEQYLAGSTLRDVATHNGICTYTIAKHLRENGIDRRKPGTCGVKNQNWRGDLVGFIAIHARVNRARGKPRKCEHCGTETAKRYAWANKDHRNYLDVDNYIRLCYSCHLRYDYKYNSLSREGRGKSRKVL